MRRTPPAAHPHVSRARSHSSHGDGPARRRCQPIRPVASHVPLSVEQDRDEDGLAGARQRRPASAPPAGLAHSGRDDGGDGGLLGLCAHGTMLRAGRAFRSGLAARAGGPRTCVQGLHQRLMAWDESTDGQVHVEVRPVAGHVLGPGRVQDVLALLIDESHEQRAQPDDAGIGAPRPCPACSPRKPSEPRRHGPRLPLGTASRSRCERGPRRAGEPKRQRRAVPRVRGASERRRLGARSGSYPQCSGRPGALARPVGLRPGAIPCARRGLYSRPPDGMPTSRPARGPQANVPRHPTRRLLRLPSRRSHAWPPAG